MITNTSDTIIVDGVNTASVHYKRDDNEIVDTQICIVGENGMQTGLMAIAITGEVITYFIKPILLHEASVYNISGVAIPGDTLVHISSGFVGGSVDALENNIIFTTYADSHGNFEFKNINYQDGVISLWMTALSKDAPTASLTYDLSIVDYNPNCGDLLTYNFKEATGEHKYPLFTVSGVCSDDIECVYMSSVENAMSVSHLMGNICSSATPSNGIFTIKYTGEYEQDYTVWALSKIGGYLTVNQITVKNDNSVCLSGDTMITMSDGTVKRMDSICIGDIVLSKDGVHANVHTVRRGCFSNYHTLYRFEDGTIIDETHPHRFYNIDQGFWQRLELWNIGDHAINQHGNAIALVSVERLEENVEMFGIWTDNGTYYANGLLSGAAFCNKDLLAEATAEQAIDMMLSADEEMLVELMGLEGILP